MKSYAPSEKVTLQQSLSSGGEAFTDCLGECYWCPIQLQLSLTITTWGAPTPLRAFLLLTLLRSGLFMPINNETRPR